MNKKTEVITFRTDADTKAKIEAIAKRERMVCSTSCRQDLQTIFHL